MVVVVVVVVGSGGGGGYLGRVRILLRQRRERQEA
jgi:hypothetical protein